MRVMEMLREHRNRRDVVEATCNAYTEPLSEKDLQCSN